MLRKMLEESNQESSDFGRLHKMHPFDTHAKPNDDKKRAAHLKNIYNIHFRIGEIKCRRRTSSVWKVKDISEGWHEKLLT